MWGSKKDRLLAAMFRRDWERSPASTARSARVAYRFLSAELTPRPAHYPDIMDASIGTYLNDHLAGAAFALKMVRRLARHDSDPLLRELAAHLFREISHDRQQLETLVRNLGFKPSRVKNLLARLGEKISRLKLSRTPSGDRGAFEALEALSLGILGKHALWTALETLEDPALRHVHFATLKQRALAQHAQTESHRLRTARLAFATQDQRTNAG
jgi:hypothetical protein